MLNIFGTVHFTTYALQGLRNVINLFDKTKPFLLEIFYHILLWIGHMKYVEKQLHQCGSLFCSVTFFEFLFYNR